MYSKRKFIKMYEYMFATLSYHTITHIMWKDLRISIYVIYIILYESTKVWECVFLVVYIWCSLFKSRICSETLEADGTKNVFISFIVVARCRYIIVLYLWVLHSLLYTINPCQQMRDVNLCTYMYIRDNIVRKHIEIDYIMPLYGKYKRVSTYWWTIQSVTKLGRY